MNTHKQEQANNHVSFSDPIFEDIVLLASTICESPIAFISYIDENRQWFKARIGLGPSQIPREFSICEYVLKTKNTFMVEDLQADSRFENNPVVHGTSGIKFYLGLPIVCPEGFILGTLCVADHKPRKISDQQLSCMGVLARQLLQKFEYEQSVLKITSITEELIDSNKASSLGMFSMYMAHEINNALHISQGYTACVIKSNSQDSLIPLLTSIQKMNNRIAKIVSGIKLYSRNAKDDLFEPMSVKLIMEETKALCQERFKNNDIAYTTALPDEELFIDCHASEIVQVLLNLINNAVDAVATVSDKWIRAEVKRVGDQVEFSISNCGEAIPPEVAKKLMTPFFTTKRQGKGTGLGLHISKSIIEFHSGNFFFDKDLPTRFGFTLPLKK
jgi:signal transduction histidine kinase